MQKFGIRVLRGTLRLLSKLPLRVHYALGGFVAWVLRVVVRYRRAVVDRNLALCFPEKSERERKAIRRGFYRHLGQMAGEAVWFGGCRNPERLRRARLVEIESLEGIGALCAAAPGVIVLQSHFGNWELLGGVGSYNYTDAPMPFTEQNFCVVYMRQSNPGWDDLLRENRFAPLIDPAHFEGYIESRDVLRYAFEHRDDKKVINMNTDQRPYAIAKGVDEVVFMGQRTYTMTGPAALARKLGFAVAYASVTRDRRGHHTLRYLPICEDASGRDPKQIMQQFYQLLEQDIRQHPEQYLWTHRRFDKPKNLQTQ